MVGDIFQPTHLLFVLVVALLVLGPKRLPEVGRTLGSGIRDFRSALSGETPSPAPERSEPEAVHAPPEPPLPASTDTESVRPDPESAPTGHEFAYESSESAEKRTEPGV